MQLFNPLLLVDCCSLFCAILRIQPRSDDLCAKLMANRLRDLQTMLPISPIDASENLGDMETKRAGSLTILSKFMIAGLFSLSFMGRKQVSAKKVVSEKARRTSQGN